MPSKMFAENMSHLRIWKRSEENSQRKTLRLWRQQCRVWPKTDEKHCFDVYRICKCWNAYINVIPYSFLCRFTSTFQ